MAKINIVVPTFNRTKVTGGPWCLMEYAWGLAQRGHEVRVIPIVPSPCPQWFDRKDVVWVYDAWTRRAAQALQKCAVFSYEAARRVFFGAMGISRSGQEMVAAGLLATNFMFYPEEVELGARLLHLRRNLPPADAILATSYPTVLPVWLLGKGQQFFFPQHYEPLLVEVEPPHSRLAKFEVEAAYSLGVTLIANSTWLQETFRAHHPTAQIHLCPNAINRRVFSGEPRRRASNQEVNVISYGGRGAEWKGFREMAEAVKIARKTLPGVNVRWLVYGLAAYPPQNPVANYEPLGQLDPPALAKAYATADILLSASWYESFPLFPMEAMACGLPVITTQPGTEDYAIPGETAEVVQPKDPHSIAKGLVHLIQDTDYAAKVATAGWEMSKRFTWERSVTRMENILLGNGTV